MLMLLRRMMFRLVTGWVFLWLFIVSSNATRSESLNDRSKQGVADEIDRLIEKDLAAHGLSPNPALSDELFVRRVYLDVIGRIPTVEEFDTFMQSKGSDRRAELIDRLLASEGYVSHYFHFWADALRLRNTTANPNDDPLQSPQANYAYWLKQSLRENKLYDQFVRELLTTSGSLRSEGVTGYYLRDEGNRLANFEATTALFLGVSLGHALSPRLALSDERAAPKAKSVIYLFMRGGMSHLDTFDPKPDAGIDIQGPVSAIPTSVPGVRVTEYLPKTARLMNQLALIRSMCHNQGAHEPGEYLMRTGFEKQTGIRHPALGAWCMELRKEAKRELPGYVRVGDLGGHPANGFFEVRSGPIPISNPSKGLQNIRPQKGFHAEAFERGLQLAANWDREFLKQYNQPNVRAYGDLYDDAVRLMRSRDLDAFDLTQEPKALREQYGNSPFGQGCLLARRLVEKGVDFVEVDFGDWDTHVANHTGVQSLCAIFDQTFPSLLEDLQRRGLLETTLIVLVTEFGRMPEIDEFAGRGHWPRAFTCMLAGAGIQAGAVYGASDERGEEVIDQPTSILDLHATVATLMGLPLTAERSPSADGQVFSVIGKDTGTKGTPIQALLS